MKTEDTQTPPANPPANPPAPPESAVIVENGKTEAELLELRKKLAAVEREKKNVELENIRLATANHELKQVAPPAHQADVKKKFQWMGFGSD